jgi:hypothetical protein
LERGGRIRAALSRLHHSTFRDELMPTLRTDDALLFV